MGRGLARDLFLRLLGLIFLAAFLSVLWQAPVLFGSRGLLPADAYLRHVPGVLDAPTVFWLGSSDAALRAGGIAGALASIALALGVAPRASLLACWVLYLSFVTVGQAFFSFQWDNLLLEAGLMALFVTPAGLLPRKAPAPHPLGVFLMLWLLFRLQVESGLAKLLLGDPTWRDLTALVSYYETAPLPTWVGWWVHQLPVRAHQASGAVTYVCELLLPLLFWAPAPVRLAAFVGMVGFQATIIATANYAFFNYLTIALALFLLDDAQLTWAAARVGIRVTSRPPHPVHRYETAALGAVVAILIPLSIVPFLSFVPPARGLARTLLPVRAVMEPFRSLNAYHLFAQMTLIRREVVIEGASDDGSDWKTYEFRYKPGDPARPPAFVAPHQPRVDFQLWFLLLRGAPSEPYFESLLARLLTDPSAVAPLFSIDPFPDTPPRLLRLGFYRYRFTDLATRRREGTWWQRELLGHSRIIRAEDLARVSRR